MENILLSSVLFLLTIFAIILVVGKRWNNSFLSFLFADRSLTTIPSGMAISSHWFWAIAIFVGPAVAYNWGIIGLMWFVIPNAISLLVVGHLISRIRDKYPEGYSLTSYIKENFSKRVSGLYQINFSLVAFAALVLAFTAINKLWGFTGLSSFIEPIYASLVIGLITLGFTMFGGIRTSIFTGSIQTALWLILLGIASIAVLFSGDYQYLSFGKNNLETIFDQKFLTTFAVTWFIAIIVGATGHGMMWQKAFSMSKEKIMPSFTLGAIIFAVICFGIAQFGMFAFANSLEVAQPDTSQMISLQALLGIGAIIAFATILIGQTSTVMDSALNYMSSLASTEWLKKSEVGTSRMIMLAFMLLSWSITLLKIEIWTVLMVMGCIRISMFMPIVYHVYDVKIRETALFYGSLFAVSGSLVFSYMARTLKMPIYDMYSALFALMVPAVILWATRKRIN